MGRGVGKVLDGLKLGETVLVEYEAYSSPELFLAILQNYALERGKPVLIDDIVDTLPEYVERLKLMGVDFQRFTNVSVIKIGGSRESGNVVGHLEVDKYRLDFKYYDNIYKKVASREVINPVLGVYKLFGLFRKHELLRLARNIASFVGRRSRVAYYFLNVEVVETISPEMLPLLEEASTTILRWGREGRSYRLEVVKACDEDITGSSVVVGVGDIKEGKL